MAGRIGQPRQRLNPEKVAYWYFRLNRFLQIENFVVHPGARGGQRTDADLLAVRFPHRAEFLFDHSDPMVDDVDALSLSAELIDVVIAEVKTNRCALNGPWTCQDKENVHRVLAAIGCLPRDRVGEAAADIYRAGIHQNGKLRIRLVAMGRERNGDLAVSHPNVTQLIWVELLAFIWNRFHTYRQQKTDVPQWDWVGQRLRDLSTKHRDQDNFVKEALELFGVRRDE